MEKQEQIKTNELGESDVNTKDNQYRCMKCEGENRSQHGIHCKKNAE